MRSLLTLLAVLVGGALHTENTEAQQPNILLITADDLNYDSLGCFGNKLPGVTPNLDQLASEGTRFEHAYVTIAICQPCRASIMTGRYPHRSGALGFDIIRKNVPTLPETLRAANYYSAAIGKAVHTIPSRHKNAFDETYDMKDLGNGRSPERYRAKTAGAIAKAKEQGKRFFLNVNLHDPHRPFANSAQEKRDKKPQIWEDVPLVDRPYQPNEVKVPGFLPDLPEIRLEISEYYTSVRRCDQIIGEVLQVLDESGESHNTVVIFLSDHGISVPFAKTNCWMHSNRTPLIVRWPGRTTVGGIIHKKMVSSIDLAPTILDIVGLENLEDADGVSFRGLIDTSVHDRDVGRDDVLVHLNYPHNRKPFPMRGVITTETSYIWNGWSNSATKFSNESMSGRTFAAMKNAAKKDSTIARRVQHYLYRCPEEFYDLKKDRDSLQNLIERTDYQQPLLHARERLLEHMQRSQDPQLDAFKKTLNRVTKRP